MTPAARVQAAIEIVDAWLARSDRLDRLLTQWGRSHRFAGSGDRHAIADLVYDCIRHLRSAGFVAGAGDRPTGRDLVRGTLLIAGQALPAIFSGEKFAPPPLAEHETVDNHAALADAAWPVRLDVPDWLAPHVRCLGDAVLAAMQDRAPLDLRVNTLKADWHQANLVLAQDGIEVAPTVLGGTGMRVLARPRRVASSRAYKEGLVEIQDSASQYVAHMAGANPGETVLDLCAGGGGKTLALAAAMQGKGRLMAYDVAEARLAQIPERARRAGADVEILSTSDLPDLAGCCDLVFVDAPCSGSGAWRRNPDAKWTLSEERLDELRSMQQTLLARAAGLVTGPGRIAYATCSLLQAENQDQTRSFCESSGWRLEAERALTPLDGGDGFYCAILRRSDGSIKS